MDGNLRQARADFYLTLAQAFRVPTDEAFRRAFITDLVNDLSEMDREIGYGSAAEISEFARCAAALADDTDALLQIYSRLFLQPPRAVHLNTGVYLDGMLGGGSVWEIQKWYREAGLEKSENLKDLPDHIVAQLEFVAFLYGQARSGKDAAGCRAGEFVGRFVARWAPALVDNLTLAERELGFTAEPYLQLARILAKAARHDAVAPADLDPARLRREQALVWARRKQAEKGVTEKDLETIRRRLAERGLATDHLAIDYEQRDAARGWRVGTPPAPRGK